MTTADRIRNRRLELGLTQLEVAKRLGLTTKAAVSKVEGQGDNVTLKNVEKFAKALNCSKAYLMGWLDEDNEDIKENETEYDEQFERFKRYYSQLNQDQRKVIDNLLASLVKKQ